MGCGARRYEHNVLGVEGNIERIEIITHLQDRNRIYTNSNTIYELVNDINSLSNTFSDKPLDICEEEIEFIIYSDTQTPLRGINVNIHFYNHQIFTLIINYKIWLNPILGEFVIEHSVIGVEPPDSEMQWFMSSVDNTDILDFIHNNPCEAIVTTD